MTCCQSCALGHECESECIAGAGVEEGIELYEEVDHTADGLPYELPELVGDADADRAGRTAAQIDRAIGDTVADLFGSTPFGGLIDAVHETRMRAMEAALPQFYERPQAAAPMAPAPMAPAPGAPRGPRAKLTPARLRELLRSAPVRRIAQSDAINAPIVVQARAAEDALIAELRAMALRSIEGDADAEQYFRRLKLAAARGDLVARRRLAAAAVLLPRKGAGVAR